MILDIALIITQRIKGNELIRNNLEIFYKNVRHVINCNVIIINPIIVISI